MTRYFQGLKSMTPDEIEELKNAPATLHEQVQAIYHGTEAYWRFANDYVVPLIKGLLSRTDQETAIAGTYYRMVAWAESLVELKRPVHIQAVCSGARSAFELLLDLKELSASPANADALNAFTFVERFRAAKMLVKFHDDNFGTDPASLIHERKFIGDAANIAKYDSLRGTYWGMTGSEYPKHWSKPEVFRRAASLGTDYEEIYRSDYPRFSWYIHAGATGFGNISSEGIESGYGWAHARFQAYFHKATEQVCNSLRLFDAEPKLRDGLEHSRLIPGKSLVYALKAAKDQAAKATEPESK